MAGDAAADVRYIALEALEQDRLEEEHIERLESYLTRKSGELRSGILAILLKQDDATTLASGTRLLSAKDANQRLAGLELLRLMTETNRCVAQCRGLAADYEASRKRLSKDERAHLDEISAEKASAPTLDDALGFMNPAERTPAVPPRDLHTPFVTVAAVACLNSLDDLVHKYRETPIPIDTYSGVQEHLLGNVEWGFPRPHFKGHRIAKTRNCRWPTYGKTGMRTGTHRIEMRMAWNWFAL